MPFTPQISIIIPTLNEADCIGSLLDFLNTNTDGNLVKEILVVDGGSIDDTKKIAKEKDALVLEAPKSRAKQMNFGANHAKGNVLYFLHADTFPPKSFENEISKAIASGFEAGCFRMQFDTRNPVLRFFASLSRVNHIICRGGDQSLFVKKSVFLRNQGFNEDYRIYEDTEFIKRLYADVGFKVLPQNVVTSARRYQSKKWYKVQFYFGMIHLKNYMGAKPEELYSYYQRKLLM